MLTFGGMGLLPCVSVARVVPYRTKGGRGVFALVVRCRIMILFVYCRVGKNRDTKGESSLKRGSLCRHYKSVVVAARLSRHRRRLHIPTCCGVVAICLFLILMLLDIFFCIQNIFLWYIPFQS